MSLHEASRQFGDSIMSVQRRERANKLEGEFPKNHTTAYSISIEFYRTPPSKTRGSISMGKPESPRSAAPPKTLH